MDFLKEANSILPELVKIRHAIHENPESGNHEFKTAALIEGFLNELGIETFRVSDTAVTGSLKFAHPGKTIAFRADIDALPVTERTGCDFSSENPGLMHACGHDVHTAALLGAAKLLSMHKDELSGCVKFFFEPDEEGEGGAKRMINAGCMEGVSAVYGAHVDPYLPLWHIGYRFGKFYAASYMFNVTVYGKSAHGADEKRGIDALCCASKMVTSLKELPKKFPEGEAVLSIGTFESGTARNIIADKAGFKGIIRTLGDDVRDGMINAFNDTVNEIASAFGAKADIKIFSTHNGVVNTQRETGIVKEAIEDTDGLFADEISSPLLISEDFGYFIDEAAGSFYHVGAGSSFPLHSDRFLPDDKAIAAAAAAHLAVAFKELA